ncbi:MAG: hypothetical protein ABSB37_19450 [Xanthobacteraceae bacterium]|jgi:hypothetical protein
MTWTEKDAYRHNKAVDTAEKAERWAKVAASRHRRLSLQQNHKGA